MFQDLKNKAYAVSFKAGSIGKGGAQRRTREFWEGRGATAGPLEWRQMFLYKLSATFLSTINVKINGHAFSDWTREYKTKIRHEFGSKYTNYKNSLFSMRGSLTEKKPFNSLTPEI